MPAIQIGISTLILGNTEVSFVGRVNGILTPLFMGAMVITMSLRGRSRSPSHLNRSTCIGVTICDWCRDYGAIFENKSGQIPQPSSELK